MPGLLKIKITLMDKTCVCVCVCVCVILKNCELGMIPSGLRK